MLQSDDYYPLVYVSFDYGYPLQRYSKRFSKETFHQDISIGKGSDNEFSFTAFNVKESRIDTEHMIKVDYRTMVLEWVVIDSKDPMNGPTTQMQFRKLADAQALYQILGLYFNREFLLVNNNRKI